MPFSRRIGSAAVIAPNSDRLRCSYRKAHHQDAWLFAEDIHVAVDDTQRINEKLAIRAERAAFDRWRRQVVLRFANLGDKAIDLRSDSRCYRDRHSGVPTATVLGAASGPAPV